MTKYQEIKEELTYEFALDLINNSVKLGGRFPHSKYNLYLLIWTNNDKRYQVVRDDVNRCLDTIVRLGVITHD